MPFTLSLPYQLLISTVVINAIVYFIIGLRARKNGTANTYSIAKFILITTITVILHSMIYFSLLFFKFNETVSNSYSENAVGEYTYVLTKSASLYTDLGAPNYIGTKMKDLSLKAGDTAYTLASYQQGDFVSGKSFSKIHYQGKSYWFIPDDVSQSLFKYIYENQPLSFEVTPENDKLYWSRAKFYMKAYEARHQGKELDYSAITDTVMNVRWYRGYLNGYLELHKKQQGAKYLYVVKGGTYKSSEKTILKSVKDRFGNAPLNEDAFVYYIRNGNFFIDSYSKK